MASTARFMGLDTRERTRPPHVESRETLPAPLEENPVTVSDRQHIVPEQDEATKSQSAALTMIFVGPDLVDERSWTSEGTPPLPGCKPQK